MAKFIVDGTAFSHSQVNSKIWLCEKLEELLFAHAPAEGFTIWLYGGWYGITAFLLAARNNLPVFRVRNFDIDKNAVTISNMMNEGKVFEDWGFRAFVNDCNTLNPAGDLSEVASGPPQIIINTAIEHFHEDKWWNTIPSGTFVALQASTLSHKDHLVESGSIEDLKKRFLRADWIFEGEKIFSYSDEAPFKRFMLIGKKTE